MTTTQPAKFQDLKSFKLPANFRGRPAWYVQSWWIIQSTLFGCSPQMFYAWRRWLLRRFGAKIGEGVIIRPTARLTFPWKVTIGDHAWIGDHVVLYSLGEITIGPNAVISQKSYICTGSHDPFVPTFDIFAKPISIGAESWIATDVFVAPGVTIGPGALIAARSAVFTNIPPATIARGTPAKVIGPRTMKTPQDG